MSYENAANASGMTVSAWVRDRLRTAALREKPDSPSLYTSTGRALPDTYVAEARPIWEEILEVGAAIPASEWEKLPRDLARNLDRYLDSPGW